MTKQCKACHKMKPLDCFSVRKKASDGLQYRCKECCSKSDMKLFFKNRSDRYVYNKNKFKVNWDWYVSLKDNQKCMDCNVSYAYYQLDYDHRDPSKKLDHVGMLISYGRTKVLEEIAKCDLVCKNCHAKRTYLRRKGP